MWQWEELLNNTKTMLVVVVSLIQVLPESSKQTSLRHVAFELLIRELICSSSFLFLVIIVSVEGFLDTNYLVCFSHRT